MFVGRQQELRALEDAYRSDRSAFLPVYGRRRVGKTALLLKFVEAKPGTYYLGKRAPRHQQIREFLQRAAVALDQPLLAKLSTASWKEAFQEMTTALDRENKFVLVLDEFQWMAESSPELPSVLQEMWDLHWSRSGKWMLLLCGSYIGFMEREVLGSQSPLFGRRTGQIRLLPFSYREAALFHPHLSLADRAKIFFICGGIPYYLQAFEESESIRSNVQSRFLDPTGPLSNEPDFLLREELRDVEVYYAILMGIAGSGGAASPSDIETNSGITARNLPYYIKNLENLGYVAKRHPLTHKKPSAKQVRYALEDPLLRFWFRFLYPHTTELAQYSPAENYEDLIQSDVEAYFGLCFERMCRDALPFLYHDEGVRTRAKIGEYWDRKVQIDLVSLRQDDCLDIGECKWGAIRSWPDLRGELQQKIAAYPNPQNQTIRGRLFVRDTPTAKQRQTTEFNIHSLADLYGEELSQ